MSRPAECRAGLPFRGGLKLFPANRARPRVALRLGQPAQSAQAHPHYEPELMAAEARRVVVHPASLGHLGEATDSRTSAGLMAAAPFPDQGDPMLVPLGGGLLDGLDEIL